MVSTPSFVYNAQNTGHSCKAVSEKHSQINLPYQWKFFSSMETFDTLHSNFCVCIRKPLKLQISALWDNY